MPKPKLDLTKNINYTIQQKPHWKSFVVLIILGVCAVLFSTLTVVFMENMLEI